MSKKWQTKKIGDFLTLEYGKPLDKLLRKQGGKYPAYGANGVKAWSDDFYYDKKTIIIGRKGSAGEITLTEEKFWPLDVTYFVKFDEEKYDLYFIYYMLSCLNLPDLATGVKPGINRNNVYSIEVKVPTIQEQKRIVAILDQAFADIEKIRVNTEKNLKNAREFFESYLHKIFSQRGEGWCNSKLGAVCEVIQRGIPPKYIDNGGLCVVNQKCVRDHNINYDLARRHNIELKNVKEDRYIKIGDVLVNSTGTGTLGRVAQVRNEPDEPTTVDTHVTIVRPLAGKFYDDFFGYMLIKIEDEIALSGEGASGQTELSRSTLKNNFNISYPIDKKQQKIIVEELDMIKQYVSMLEKTYSKKLSELDHLKKSLLHQAFTGQLTKQGVAA